MERHARDRRRYPVDRLERGGLLLLSCDDDLTRHGVEPRQRRCGRAVLAVDDSELAAFHRSYHDRREASPRELARNTVNVVAALAQNGTLIALVH